MRSSTKTSDVAAHEIEDKSVVAMEKAAPLSEKTLDLQQTQHTSSASLCISDETGRGDAIADQAVQQGSTMAVHRVEAHHPGTKEASQKASESAALSDKHKLEIRQSPSRVNGRGCCPDSLEQQSSAVSFELETFARVAFETSAGSLHGACEAKQSMVDANDAVTADSTKTSVHVSSSVTSPKANLVTGEDISKTRPVAEAEIAPRDFQSDAKDMGSNALGSRHEPTPVDLSTGKNEAGLMPTSQGLHSLAGMAFGAQNSFLGSSAGTVGSSITGSHSEQLSATAAGAAFSYADGTEVREGTGYAGLRGGEESVLHATVSSLEVGVSSGLHGWLKVRADLEDGGVSASIATASSVGRDALHRELPSLAAYLHEEKVALSGLVVRESTTVGSNSGEQGVMTGGHGRTGEQSQKHESPSSSGKPRLDWRISRKESSDEVRNGLSENTGLIGTALSASGGWLNVRV